MDSILKALFEFCLKNRHDHTIYKHAGDSTRSKVNDNFEKKNSCHSLLFINLYSKDFFKKT